MPKTAILIIGGMIANATALMTTTGVYTRANLEMKFSDLDFLELAFSTRSSILDAVDSSNSCVVLILNTPFVLIHPLMTSSPSFTARGTLSPVRALVSRLALPSSTIPSIGIFSPGWTTMTVPISTSSGSTCVISLSSSMLA